MKKLFLTCITFIAPTIIYAHSKWLVPSYQNVVAHEHGTYTFYTMSSPEVWVWIAVCILVSIAAAYIDNVLPAWRQLNRFSITYKEIIDRIAQVVLGIFLVVTAIFWNVIILPSAEVNTPILVTFQYIQIVIGALLMLNILPKYAAVGLFVLTGVMTISNGIEAILENIILFALAAYFYIIHDTSSVTARVKKYAVDIVRLGTGVSLIALAFTEKLFYPELSYQFLALHHWNFMLPFFPWFNDGLFILSTGFAEMLFGIIFVLGYVTRINTVVISLFFIVSVTTMFYQAQIWEVEDFVVYCSAIILLFFSRGNNTFTDLVRKILRK